jgi:hypothetical protein
MDEADKEYETAKEHLKSFQEDGNIQVLIQVSSKMLWILGKFIYLSRHQDLYLFKYE